jgi:hypothetical protein
VEIKGGLIMVSIVAGRQALLHENYVTHADYKALEAKWKFMVERDRMLTAELAECRPDAEWVASLHGVDEYGPMLNWYKHWADIPSGTKFYIHPATRDRED